MFMLLFLASAPSWTTMFSHFLAKFLLARHSTTNSEDVDKNDGNLYFTFEDAGLLSWFVVGGCDGFEDSELLFDWIDGFSLFTPSSAEAMIVFVISRYCGFYSMSR